MNKKLATCHKGVTYLLPRVAAVEYNAGVQLCNINVLKRQLWLLSGRVNNYNSNFHTNYVSKQCHIFVYNSLKYNSCTVDFIFTQTHTHNHTQTQTFHTSNATYEKHT